MTKDEIDSIREYRRKKFDVKLIPDPYWQDGDGERMQVISVTTNGYQFNQIGFYEDELEILAKLINDKLARRKAKK